MIKTNVTHIQVYLDDAGYWRWRAKAGNGEIVATGESHNSIYDATRAAVDVFPSAEVEAPER